MKIKNYKSITAVYVCVLSLLFSSCEKWLDVKPMTQLPNAELFKDEIGFDQAMTGVYSSISGQSLYGREMSFGALDVLTGYYRPVANVTTIYNNLYTNFPYKRDNPNRNQQVVQLIDDIWKGTYNQIANLNNILQEIDAKKSVFRDDNYNVIKGEALGLRAFLHFDLLRMYGPVPSQSLNLPAIPFVDTLSSLVSPLLTTAEATDRIILDLLRAKELMENDPIKTGVMPKETVLASPISTSTLAAYHNRRYRFNYYAVVASLARVYLWKGDKVNALLMAKEVIARQADRFPWVLKSNLSSISNSTSANKDRTFTTEHVFALNIRALEEYIPTYLQGAGTNVGIHLYLNAATRNALFENSNAANLADPRYQYLLTPSGSNFYSNKLYQDANVSLWFKYQLPMIRISEMYYIAAECEPSLAEGIAWLNTVRTERNLPTLSTNAISSETALKNELQMEYQKEFLGEGQLWFYYKRNALTSLPFNTNFSRLSSSSRLAAYSFDMPDDEFIYGGRETK